MNGRYAKNYEKCDASKKIVCLYKAFKDDFTPKNAFNYFISPHLDMICDSSMMVRAQICLNLGGILLAA
jgi:hypothetical protein